MVNWYFASGKRYIYIFSEHLAREFRKVGVFFDLPDSSSYVSCLIRLGWFLVGECSIDPGVEL